jgi:hypothetical protein
MTDSGRLRITQRSLTARERTDLERQAADAERLVLVGWSEALRRWSLLGCVALAALGAFWWATLRWNLGPAKAGPFALSAGLIFLVLSGWRLHHARKGLRTIRQTWRETIDQAAVQPVFEIDVHPLRAWGSHEDGWMFDVGGSRALFVDWELPLGSPTARILAAVSPSGYDWLDQSGEELDAAPLPYLWENLRDTHPLLDLSGPVSFRLDSDPGASLRDFAEHEWLLPGEFRGA